MKRSIKRALSVGVLAVIIACFVYYIVTHAGDFKALELVSPWYFIAIALLSLIGLALGGIVIKNLVGAFGIELKFKEWFGLNVVSIFYNTITPFRGGLLARAVYLKKEHKFSYTNFIASLAGIYVINYLIASFLGLISLWLIYARYGMFSIIALLVFLFFFVPLSLIVLFSPKFPETKSEFVNKFIRVMNGWNLIKNNRKIIIIVLFAAIIQFLIGIIGAKLTYGIIGVQIPVDKLIFLVAIGTVTSILQITPGNLGVGEAISVFAALLVGITPTQSLTAAIIGRVIGLTILFILGPVFSYVLLKKGK